MALAKADVLAGAILLLDSKDDYPDDNDGYSDDSVCPNEASSFYRKSDPPKTCQWNSFGSGLMQQSFNFPIFLSRDENTTKDIRQCYT